MSLNYANLEWIFVVRLSCSIANCSLIVKGAVALGWGIWQIGHRLSQLGYILRTELFVLA